MTISHVGTVYLSGTSGTLPTHQAGDVIIVSGYSSGTTPTLPGTFTGLVSVSRLRVGYIVAAGAGTASGTWTNANYGLVASVYRGVSAVGAAASQVYVSGTTITVPALTLQDSSGSSWVLAHVRSDNGQDTAPSGLTIRTGGIGALDTAADTASGVTSFSSRTVAHGVAQPWATAVVELKGAELRSFTGSRAAGAVGSGVLTATEAGVFSGSKDAGSEVGVFGDPLEGDVLAASGAETRTATGAGVFALTDVLAMSGSETRTPTGVGDLFGLIEDGSFAGAETRTAGGYGTFVNPPPPGVVAQPARTLDEVIAGSHRTVTRAVIIAGPATGEILPVTGGGVAVDFDADVTRSGRVTVAGLPQWEPVDATDALDVRAGTEIRLEQGVTDDAGVTHWYSQGVFRPSKPTVTRDGGGLSIDVELHDRSYAVKLASIRRRWVIGGADPILQSIATVLAEVAPWLPLDIDLAGDFPAGADIVVCEYGGDVWASARQLAQSMGRWLHVDRDGVCVAPAIVDPYATEAATLPAVTSEQVGTDTATIVNVVGATWTEPRPDDAAEGWVPDGGVEEWVDRESSTSIDSPVGVRARPYSGDASVLHTPSHAAQAALSDGLRLRDLSRAARCTVVPDPRLDVGGAVTLDGYTYRVTKLDIDLSGRSDTGVDLGTARPDMARLLGAALRPGQERRLIEVVTSVAPLRTRPIYEEGSEASVRWTDALAGVAVGDRVVVLHKGMGERVGVSLLDPKPLAEKHDGEVIGIIGGADVEIGEDIPLRARIGSGSYQTFANGDVTLSMPAHQHTLDGAGISTSGQPAGVSQLGNAGAQTSGSYYSWSASNEDRARINAVDTRLDWTIGVLDDVVAYLNGGASTGSGGGSTAPTDPDPEGPPPTPTARTTIVVSPHPDDETLRLAGYISTAAARGDTMKLIAVTDGGASGAKPSGWTVDYLKSVRRAEQVAAWSALTNGAGTITRIGLNDGSATATPIKNAINAVIAASSGTVEVYVAARATDVHPDHKATAAGAKACSASVVRYSLPIEESGSGTTYSPASMSDAIAADNAYEPFGWTSSPPAFAAMRTKGYKSRIVST